MRWIIDANALGGESLGASGYGRYDFRTATRLEALTKVVADRHGGEIAGIGGRVTEPAALAALRSMRFVSAATPHALALRAEALVSHLEVGEALQQPRDAVNFEREDREGVRLARTGTLGGEIAVAARDRVETMAGRRMVERLAA